MLPLINQPKLWILVDPTIYSLSFEITTFYKFSHNSLQLANVMRESNITSCLISPFHTVLKVSFNAWSVCRDLWVSQHQPDLPGSFWSQWQSTAWSSDFRANQFFDWGKTPAEDTDACCCVSVCVFVWYLTLSPICNWVRFDFDHSWLDVV